MNLKTLSALASIAASGVSISITVKNKRKNKELERLTREIRNRAYKRVLADMGSTKLVVDRVLNGDYGVDFKRAYRDITWNHEFDRIVSRYDD